MSISENNLTMANKDDGFNCIICLSSVRIPTTLGCGNRNNPNNGCDGGLYCLDCVRDLLKLDTAPRKREGDAKCPKCQSRLGANANMSSVNYTVIEPMFAIIDSHFEKDLSVRTCSKCAKECSTQRQLWSHKKNECPKELIKCKKCRYWGLRENVLGTHQEVHLDMTCKICNEKVDKSQYVRHFQEHKRTLELQKIDFVCRLKRVTKSCAYADEILRYDDFNTALGLTIEPDLTNEENNDSDGEIHEDMRMNVDELTRRRRYVFDNNEDVIWGGSRRTARYWHTTDY